jgi:hypothetical protein
MTRWPVSGSIQLVGGSAGAREWPSSWPSPPVESAGAGGLLHRLARRSLRPRKLAGDVADNFLARPFEFETNPQREYVIYPEVCAWYGSLTVARLCHDDDRSARLVKKFQVADQYRSPAAFPGMNHVDFRVFGIVPLEIYTWRPGTGRASNSGRRFADRQWAEATARRHHQRGRATGLMTCT